MINDILYAPIDKGDYINKIWSFFIELVPDVDLTDTYDLRALKDRVKMIMEHLGNPRIENARQLEDLLGSIESI